MRTDVAAALRTKTNELATSPTKQMSRLSSDGAVTALTPLLKGFESHSLEDQSRAALMNRVDTKFILPMNSLAEFLIALKDDYTILEHEAHRLFTYKTTYFDTPDKLFYHSHHNGKLNRHKVRLRHYRDTNTAFMEVKFKNNKQRTIKTRMPIDALKPNFENAKPFLKENLSPHIELLQTSLFVNYKRITLMNKNNTERLTLDLSLSFKSSNLASQVDLPQMWIAELKQDRKIYRSSFLALVKKIGLTRLSFSKYCIGLALIDNEKFKTNFFKATLKKIAQLTQVNKKERASAKRNLIRINTNSI